MLDTAAPWPLIIPPGDICWRRWVICNRLHKIIGYWARSRHGKGRSLRDSASVQPIRDRSRRRRVMRRWPTEIRRPPPAGCFGVRFDAVDHRLNVERARKGRRILPGGLAVLRFSPTLHAQPPAQSGRPAIRRRSNAARRSTASTASSATAPTRAAATADRACCARGSSSTISTAS